MAPEGEVLRVAAERAIAAARQAPAAAASGAGTDGRRALTWAQHDILNKHRLPRALLVLIHRCHQPAGEVGPRRDL